MNTVAVLTSRRADVARRTIEALGRCKGVGGWNTILAANDATDDVASFVQNPYGLGVRLMTARLKSGSEDPHVSAASGVKAVIDLAFGTGAEIVVYLEEDAMPAPDALTYFATMVERYRDDPDVFCIGGWGHGKPGDDPYGVVRVPFFMPLGIALDRQRWEEWSWSWDWDYWARGLQALGDDRSRVPHSSKIPGPQDQERRRAARGPGAGGGSSSWNVVYPPFTKEGSCGHGCQERESGVTKENLRMSGHHRMAMEFAREKRYVEAADAEQLALLATPKDRLRTRAVLAASVAELLRKGISQSLEPG